MIGHILARNVNDAFERLKELVTADYQDQWRYIAPRGQPTMEYKGALITEYIYPDERVLFDQARDANPFFHFFEALWILAGRRDLFFLTQFLPRMADFSDDGKVLHGAYGYRMRFHFDGDASTDWNGASRLDQIITVINILRGDRDTRQAVIGIWDPSSDLGRKTKDLPCNDLVFFKVRDDKLNMTVCCRSNDAILGAYGANAVHFSFLQELVARMVGVRLGTYTQISDSFHIYLDEPSWLRAKALPAADLYREQRVKPYPLANGTMDVAAWLAQLDCFFAGTICEYDTPDPFFAEVVSPLWAAWLRWSSKIDTKVQRIDNALRFVEQCKAEDWSLACARWLERRRP